MVAITGRLVGHALEMVRAKDRQAEIEVLEEELAWLMEDEDRDDKTADRIFWLQREIDALETGAVTAKPEPYDESEAWPEGGRAPTFKENAASLKLEEGIVRRRKIVRRKLRAYDYEKDYEKGWLEHDDEDQHGIRRTGMAAPTGDRRLLVRPTDDGRGTARTDQGAVLPGQRNDGLVSRRQDKPGQVRSLAGAEAGHRSGDGVMRVLVCGGRDYADRPKLDAFLDRLHAKLPIKAVIEGDARGADRMAGDWADRRGVSCERYPADWARHGMRAGYLRNQQMLDEGKPDLVVAFEGGSGTRMMVEIARRAGLEVIEVGRD